MVVFLACLVLIDISFYFYCSLNVDNISDMTSGFGNGMNELVFMYAVDHHSTSTS